MNGCRVWAKDVFRYCSPSVTAPLLSSPAMTNPIVHYTNLGVQLASRVFGNNDISKRLTPVAYLG